MRFEQRQRGTQNRSLLSRSRVLLSSSSNQSQTTGSSSGSRISLNRSGITNRRRKSTPWKSGSVIILLGTSIVCIFMYALFAISEVHSRQSTESAPLTSSKDINSVLFPKTNSHVQNEQSVSSDAIKLSQKSIESEHKYSEDTMMDIIYNRVHVFYYGWYGTPERQKEWVHWNHDILPHWTEQENARWPIGQMYEPPSDIGSVFYPKLGAYSSSDPLIIEHHLLWLMSNHVSVLSVSWHSPFARKGVDYPLKDAITDQTIDELFRIISEDLRFRHKMFICIHLEPYSQRTSESTLSDLRHLYERFGQSPALLKIQKPNHHCRHAKQQQRHSDDSSPLLPVFYAYDSYKMEDKQWRQLFDQIRNTELDGLFLGLYLSKKESESHLLKSGFDGFYTYFASDTFTFGSNHQRNWHHLYQFAKEHHLLFVPSVGPGYDDTRVRPWNQINTKSRLNGEYYRKYWNSVFRIFDENRIDDESEEEFKSDSSIKCETLDTIPFVSVTSFNEFHEGTQIEPCVSMSTETKVKLHGKSDQRYDYQDYHVSGSMVTENDPFYYLKITKEMSDRFHSFFS